MRRSLPLLAAVMLLMVVGCESNRSGRVAAPVRGPLEAPLAARVDEMDAKRREDCGSGELTDRGLAAFRRMPYLQQLDSTGTSVLFTVGEGAVVSDALELVLTTPDGQPAGSAEVAPDGALAAAGTVPFRGRADGLSPATLYCYQVFEGDEPLTERAGFYTAPESGDTTTKFGFIAMGDTGGATEDQRSVLSQMFTVSHELVVHVGDLAYGNGTFDEFDRKHFAMYESLFNIVPHFPAPGNHDYGTDGGAPYLSVFELPENGNPSDPERYYSFDYGPIHFVSLDTNRLDDTQEAWLESDLAATDQPFVLVLGHHPPFSSGDHGSDRKVRARIVPHLVENGVQMMLAGHDHHYERTKEMDGVSYLVTGGGGIGTRPTGSSSFTALSGEVLHFVYFDYDGSNLTMHAIDATGVEFDNLVLKPR